MSSNSSVERGEKPILIRFGTWVALVLGLVWLMAALGIACGITDPKVLGHEDWERFLGFLGGLLGGITLIAIGLGMRTGEPWARPLVILFWLGVGASSIARGVLESLHTLKAWFGLEWVIFLAVALWYFYRKPNVVDYYDLIGAKRGPSY